MTGCRYCAQIHATDANYVPRPAEFDVVGDCPRCARHWRYICQHCGEASHFHGTFYCPTVQQLVCHRCALGREEVLAEFWGWEYYYAYHCPHCQSIHPALDYAEWAGQHPYQLYPDWEAERRHLWPEPRLRREALSPLTTLSPDVLTDADVAASWDAKAELWDQRYDEEGDPNRKYQSDQVLFRLLGEVAGRRILDAGCGQGYLSRILGRRGATVVGVENSPRFYELARAYHKEEPLDITYHTFQTAGLHVTHLEEPSVTARGEAELPPHYVRHLKRIPYSVAFRLERL